MADTFVRTTHQSYGSRVGNSCKGMIMAPILLILGIWLLAWNEGNSVTQHKALDEGLRLVVDVSTDSVDSANEGKLIHFSGNAISPESTTDAIFGVEASSGALKLKRTVEMYQWIESSHSETKKNTGGSTDTKTTYTYTKDWKESLVSSSGFADPNGHQNPGSMIFESQTVTADPIDVGAFELPAAVTQKINWYQPLSSSLSTETIESQDTQDEAIVFGNYFYFKYSDSSTPSSPQVGDTRVSFKEVPAQAISVVAKQTSGSLSSYSASNGASFLLVESGTVDAEEMFMHANAAVTALTWALRFVGLIIIWIALQIAVAPLSVVADVIPCIGNLLGAANCCVSFFLALATSAIVIAIAWIAYRPVVSIILLLLVGGGVYFMKQRQGGNRTAVAVAEVMDLEMQGTSPGGFKDAAPIV